MLAIGSEAPRFKSHNQDGAVISLDQFLGKKYVVLYFFPKDATPG